MINLQSGKWQFFKRKLKIMPWNMINDNMESLYPFDYCGIYNKEKSLGDLFRYINKLGEDVALESLKTYMSDRDRNLAKLHKYSVICGVKDKMEPFIKGML